MRATRTVIALTAALPLLLLMAGDALAAAEFRVSATLQDGKTVAGTLAADGVDLIAVSASREIVTVPIHKPPEWSTLKVVCEIEWLPVRHVFVVREIAWSGELVRLWEELAVLGDDGKPTKIRGTDVSKIRFVYVDRANSTPLRKR